MTFTEWWIYQENRVGISPENPPSVNWVGVKNTAKLAYDSGFRAGQLSMSASEGNIDFIHEKPLTAKRLAELIQGMNPTHLPLLILANKLEQE